MATSQMELIERTETEPRSKAGLQEVEAEIKRADAEHVRKRDSWVTLAGLAIVLILTAAYMYTVLFSPETGEKVSAFLYC